ncbi:MAG TPA: LacI family DNA-binding transcriptional regulator, partial [Candidatus Nanopelagicaceae bacterium]
MTPITIEDVAREANVSISTVSYAISGNRPISESTRLRVLDAAKKLGYHANSPATVLASGRSKVF